MDLLTGYGSDEGGSPSESEEPTEAVAAKISTSGMSLSDPLGVGIPPLESVVITELEIL